MFQFFQMLLGYNFSRIDNKCNKIWIGDKVNLLLTQKWEENIPKFYFVLESSSYVFDTHAMPSQNFLHK